MNRHASLFVILTLASAASVLIVTGCASDGTKPKDMSAADHRAEADKERTKAEQHSERERNAPDATRDPIGLSGSVPGVDDIYWGENVYSPGIAHGKDAKAHGELADQHEAAAKALEQSEEGSCKAFPPKTRGVCPLIGTVTKTEDIDDGVRVFLNDSQPSSAVAAHIQCHLAYAQTQGRKGMPGCPLYLEGVHAAEGDGYVDLTTTGDKGVGELRARAKSHVGTVP